MQPKTQFFAPTGTTKLSFNERLAAFTVESDACTPATVPADNSVKSSKSRSALGLALAWAALTLSMAVGARAQTYTDLVNFTQFAHVGSSPIQATDGNFYGMSGGGVYGRGAMFRMTPTGELSLLYSFCAQPKCADGETSAISPVLGSDGNLYGISAGGATGYGTFFKLTLDGQLTTLYNFCSTGECISADAISGVKGLMQASDGNFYGTTYEFGTSNLGTIFQITPGGKFKVLHNFCSLTNCADGESPQSAPIQGTDGNFYGTATYGGTKNGGVIYKLTPSGVYTVLHNFCFAPNCADGWQPDSIVQDASGDFLGVTSNGGNYGAGIAFKLTSTGHYTPLHSFSPSAVLPLWGAALGSDGNLYGRTMGSGLLNSGTLFEVTPSGAYTNLWTFTDCLTGCDPFYGGLYQGTNGVFYGTTIGGGTYSAGTVFALANGLGPLVETNPTMGKVGTSVLILGNNLTGSTSVSFNGVAADFTVESDTYIKARVPAGASTGFVSVGTPNGTLKSNPQFVVTR